MAHSKSAYGQYRQNGSADNSPQGVIMQKSHWIWTVLSIALITGILFMVFFPAQAAKLFTMIGF